MFCTKCGNQMPDGSKFCTKCGAPMGAAAPEIQAERTPAGGAAAGDEPAPVAVVEGAASAADSSSTPSKKKRTGLVVGIAAAVVVVLAAVGIAVANPFAAPEPEPKPAPVEAPAPEPEPAPEAEAPAEPEAAPTPEPEPAAPTLPEAWFAARADGGYSIVDENGSVTQLSNPDAVLETLFSGGLSLGSWETSEYDAEWDQVHDEQTHYALFDSAGNVAVDLDPLLAELGVTGKSSFNGSNCAYSSGRLLASVSPFEDGQKGVCLVLNEQGELVFTFGSAAEGPLSSYPRDDAYHDGVIYVQAGPSDTYLLDVDGNVLVSWKQAGDQPLSLGYGYYQKVNDEGKVYGYDGSPLFDAASVNGGDIVEGCLYYEQPRGSGIVAVEAERENPYGGLNKDLYGLYSVGTGKWLVPLGEELDAFSDANDGMLWVRTAQAADDAAVQAAAEEAPGARAPEVGPVLHSAIMDAEGNVVFDASMAEAALGIPEDFVAQYLHDGWWGIRNDNSSDPYALVCIQDGAFLGAIDAPPNLANYPNSGVYSL